MKILNIIKKHNSFKSYSLSSDISILKSVGSIVVGRIIGVKFVVETLKSRAIFSWKNVLSGQAWHINWFFTCTFDTLFCLLITPIFTKQPIYTDVRVYIQRFINRYDTFRQNMNYFFCNLTSLYMSTLLFNYARNLS